MLRLSVLALTVSMSVGAFAAPQKNEPIQPIEPAVVTDQAKVELGKQLFLIRVYLSQALFLVTHATT